MLPDELINLIMLYNDDEYYKIAELSKRYHNRYKEDIEKMNEDIGKMNEDDQWHIKSLIQQALNNFSLSCPNYVDSVFKIAKTECEWIAVRRWYMGAFNRTIEQFEMKKKSISKL